MSEETEPTLKALSDAMLHAYGSGTVDDYLIRGRALAALSYRDLRRRFVEAYRALAADLTNFDYWRDAADAGTEFELRDQPLPLESIAKEWEVVQAAVIRMFKLIKEDPALREEWDREMEPIARKLIDPKAKN